MRNLLLIIFFLASIQGTAQNESCEFSDGNYHYFLWLEDDTPIGFNKSDFISYLETNSNISSSEVTFLESNLVEVYRSVPYLDSDPENKLIRVEAIDEDLVPFFLSLNESINQATMYCDCLNSDGFFHFYVRLIIDDIPSSDFDKTDFINHIQTNSSPSSSDLDFFNSSISSVSLPFPSSQSESLQKTLLVISDYDLMMPYLHQFSEALNLVELICSEAELSITDYRDPKDLITITPNPIVETSIIKIDDQFSLEELQIIDLNGKILYHKNIRGYDMINMNEFNLNSGLYFIKFSEQKSSIIKKIVVQ